MNTRDAVRVQAVSATWASVCAVLLLSMAVHAASSNPKQEHESQELPVATTVPTDEAVRVRPDTAVSFQLDTQAPEYLAFRQRLESGRFAIQVEDGTTSQLFVGELQDASAGRATFDAETGTVSTPALSLRRYTTYTVTLAVKAAYEALLHGEPLSGNDSFSFAFITGSALHEPTHYQIVVEDTAPRVTGQARLTVVATDDYGNPAWGSLVSVRLEEDGTRLASSARVTPAEATLSEPGGSVSFTLTDTEAEGVRVSLQATGPSPENAWSGTAALRFRPGTPVQALLSELPAMAQVATQLTVKGSVVDVYGNAVEDGSKLRIIVNSVLDVTTQGGAFSATYTLPTRASTYTLQVISMETPDVPQLASATLQLLPGEPKGININVSSIPPSLVVGSSVNVCGTVVDAYGNRVLDGTPVTVNGGATITYNGNYCVQVTAPTKPGTFSVVIKAGSVTHTRSTEVRSGPLAAIKRISVPSSVETNASFQVCATAMDAYDNPIPALAIVEGGVLAPVHTLATAGRFCANLKAPNYQSVINITLTATDLVYDTTKQVTAKTGTIANAPAPAFMSLSFTPSSDSVPADGSSTYTFTAYVTDKAGQPVADKTLVTWSFTMGVPSSQGVWTVGGVATITLRSFVPGTASVTATAGSISQTASVTFVP
ncbi:hypothetical protein F0U61_31185 [Archangium violaceum]|uniref:Ig-like domain-containing protein n=1 Tax=Archangium violaceum TaxID=83451 RepID=UPI002B2C885B|nr:hypothetical protein F0U61_31185 [Archangium violaceum]